MDPGNVQHLKAVMGHFCSGVVVVTALHEGRPVGFTCQSFASLSLDPPLVVAAPAKRSTTFPLIRAAGSFVANILAEQQAELARAFAVSGADKFAGVRWTLGAVGAPILDGALGWAGCRIVAEHEAGDHTLVVGEVRELGHAPAGAPLTFFRGRFTALRSA
ncbi:MAG TPA: flavin reductase family protein [Conexibacter sp.]|nr:flavin reductase family protein [Conexibacter sp.]